MYDISKHKNSGNIKLLSTDFDQIYLFQKGFTQAPLSLILRIILHTSRPYNYDHSPDIDRSQN